MDEAVVARRADGLFVEAHRHRARGPRCERSPRRPVRRGSRNSPGNSPPRPAVACDAQPEPPGAAVARRLVQESQHGGLGQRAVKVIFRRFEHQSQDAVQSSRCALDAASMADGIVAGKKARLQLADPVPALGERQVRVTQPSALRSEARRTAHRRRSRISASSRGASGRARAAVAMMSMTSPNRIFCANARPCSASRCTSMSGSPAARRFVIR